MPLNARRLSPSREPCTMRGCACWRSISARRRSASRPSTWTIAHLRRARSTGTRTARSADGDGSLRWDWPAIVAEVVRGLEAGLASGPVAGIGIDTWGVDYGLLGADGELLSPPFSYRDERTADYREVAERLGGRELFRSTGVLPMEIDTVFQLAAHDPAELARATRFLMLPELLAHRLGAEPTGEFTSAGTTGLVDLDDGHMVRTPARREDGHRPGDLPADQAGGDRRRFVAGGPAAPGRQPRHRVGGRGDGPLARAGSGVRLDRHVDHRRGRDGPARHDRPRLRRGILERTRRPRRLPAPEERDGLLDPRPLSRLVGQPRPGGAGGGGGGCAHGRAGLRRERRPVLQPAGHGGRGPRGRRVALLRGEAGGRALHPGVDRRDRRRRRLGAGPTCSGGRSTSCTSSAGGRRCRCSSGSSPTRAASWRTSARPKRPRWATRCVQGIALGRFDDLTSARASLATPERVTATCVRRRPPSSVRRTRPGRSRPAGRGRGRPPGRP